MKKVLYLATTALLIAACTNDSYTINGTIEGVADGVKVYLNRAELADLIVIDSTTTYQGKFSFQGTQKEMAVRYITFQTEEMSRPKLLDLFLESGNIDIAIGEEGSSVTGTPNNDIMQEIRDVETKISNHARVIIDSLSTNELSEDEYAEKGYYDIPELGISIASDDYTWWVSIYPDSLHTLRWLEAHGVLNVEVLPENLPY